MDDKSSLAADAVREIENLNRWETNIQRGYICYEHDIERSQSFVPFEMYKRPSKALYVGITRQSRNARLAQHFSNLSFASRVGAIEFVIFEGPDASADAENWERNAISAWNERYPDYPLRNIAHGVQPRAIRDNPFIVDDSAPGLVTQDEIYELAVKHDWPSNSTSAIARLCKSLDVKGHRPASNGKKSRLYSLEEYLAARDARINNGKQIMAERNQRSREARRQRQYAREGERQLIKAALEANRQELAKVKQLQKDQAIKDRQEFMRQAREQKKQQKEQEHQNRLARNKELQELRTPPPGYLTVMQTAKKHHTTAKSVQGFIQDGRLEAIKSPDGYLYWVRDVDSIERKRTGRKSQASLEILSYLKQQVAKHGNPILVSRRDIAIALNRGREGIGYHLAKLEHDKAIRITPINTAEYQGSQIWVNELP